MLGVMICLDILSLSTRSKILVILRTLVSASVRDARVRVVLSRSTDVSVRLVDSMQLFSTVQ